MLKKFSTRDLIVIASLAGIGFAMKLLIGPLFKMISIPLMVPGGSLAGGFYMMWLVLAVVIVSKRGSGTLFGFLQALIALVAGSKNQGLLTVISYTLPGLALDLAFPSRLFPAARLHTHLIFCALANLIGAGVIAILLFHHPLPALAVVCGMALISGLLGGFVSWGIYQPLKQYKVIQ